MKDKELPESPFLRPFFAGEDQELLRRWVDCLYKREAANSSLLTAEMLEWLEKENYPRDLAFPRVTLDRFMKREEKTEIRSHRKMRAFWNFLASRKEYRSHFPDPSLLKNPPMPEFKSPEELLAYALAFYFPSGEGMTKGYKLSTLRALMCGTFVMYRPDLECALEAPAREQVRVSELTISLLPHSGLEIMERQDFLQQDGSRYLQINTGVLIPHGPFVLAFMKCDGTTSFKLMVVETIMATFHGEPTPQFQGKILVASDRASFPSVRFFCKRMKGKVEFGRHPYDVAPPDAREFLKAPTFPKYGTIVC